MNVKKPKKSNNMNKAQEIKEERKADDSNSISKEKKRKRNNNFYNHGAKRGGKKESINFNSKRRDEYEYSLDNVDEFDELRTFFLKSKAEEETDTSDKDSEIDADISPLPVLETAGDDSEEKIEIVGVRFKPVGKIYFFAPDNAEYTINDKVIVETSRGIELGYVVIENKKVEISKIIQPLKQIQRRASQEDIERVQNNKKLAKQAIIIADERVKSHGLKLKLIEAEYTFDNSKLLYYFTAENRIDFRELVKDLASIFKIRIELRQIGIRDQTKIVGGLSICGRPFCCNSFLQDFEQVTIKMAKEQNISINSAKISGACGRLMCCLRYEHETYEALYKDMPKVSSIVETPTGETGVVIETNILAGMCKVKINAKHTDQGIDLIKFYSKKELKSIGFIKGGEVYSNGGNDDDAVLKE